MNAPVAKLAFVDDLKSPEIFVSGVAGADIDGPNLRLVFVSRRSNQEAPNEPPKFVVNLRLVMSMQQAQGMHQWLGEFLASVQPPPADAPKH